MKNSLRLRFLLYLTLLWLLVAVMAVMLLFQQPGARLYLIPLELGLFLLFLFGQRLVRRTMAPIELLNETTRMLAEGDFTLRLRPVGHTEVDGLIQLYNRMAEQLQREKVFSREQEHFLEKVLRATTSGIITFSFDNRRVDQVNPAAARLLGPAQTYLMENDLASTQDNVIRVMVNLKAGESCILNLPGGRRLKAERGYFMDRGFQRGFIFLDELTEALRQTERDAYGKLIRIMSHEINNSIGAANSLLHSLSHYSNQIREEDREDFRNALAVVISRTEHLKAFTSEYAAVVKLPKPTKAPVDLAELLDHVLVLLKADLESRDIRVIRQITAQPPIQLDRLQMEQVLLNILKNAAEAIGSQGEIYLSLVRERERLVLRVEDNGGGISAEASQSLFTPFFTTKQNGQGIGLTLTGEILSHHGAEFTLENGSIGGARFTIWFEGKSPWAD